MIIRVTLSCLLTHGATTPCFSFVPTLGGGGFQGETNPMVITLIKVPSPLPMQSLFLLKMILFRNLGKKIFIFRKLIYFRTMKKYKNSNKKI